MYVSVERNVPGLVQLRTISHQTLATSHPTYIVSTRLRALQPKSFKLLSPYSATAILAALILAQESSQPSCSTGSSLSPDPRPASISVFILHRFSAASLNLCPSYLAWSLS
eukprot:3144505-Rhodomonas_salina.2